MENNQEKQEILEELNALHAIITDNPCGLPKTAISGLKVFIRDIIAKYCTNGATREQVAEYFHIDVRTLARWKNDYPDFPSGERHGTKQTTYNWVDIVRWKLHHPELFTD